MAALTRSPAALMATALHAAGSELLVAQMHL
jgi:hypothetical protein